MPPPFYVIRCYASIGPTYVIEDMAETSEASARYAASFLSDIHAGVVVLDPAGAIIEQFGEVPAPP